MMLQHVSHDNANAHHMMSHHLLPQSYQAWYDCMTVTYRLKLTLGYIEARIVELEDTGDERTLEFIELCGSDYHQQVLAWFEQAKEEL